MCEETRKLLEWQINNLLEYRAALERKGLFESVETVNYVLNTTQQFLNNPKMVEYVANKLEVTFR